MTSAEATTIRLLEQIAVSKDHQPDAEVAAVEPAILLRALTQTDFDLTATIVAVHRDH